MAFNRAAFREHLQEAVDAELPYYEYDALWKAFNVYYGSFYKSDDPQRIDEADLIGRALRTIPEGKLSSILSQTLTQRFRRIEPIADAQSFALIDAWLANTLKHVLPLTKCGQEHQRRSATLKPSRMFCISSAATWRMARSLGIKNVTRKSSRRPCQFFVP